jgi:uncharacterized membrane protein
MLINCQAYRGQSTGHDIIGSFNIAFGETTVLFGILFVGTSLTLAMG